MKTIDTAISLNKSRVKSIMNKVVDEVVKFYSGDINKRGIVHDYMDDDTCVYFTNEYDVVCKCGVGHFMTNDMARVMPNGSVESIFSNGIDYGVLYCGGVYNQVPGSAVFEDPEINAIYPFWGFWSNIQSLHDQNHNWNETGLSDTGIRLLNEIKTFKIENETNWLNLYPTKFNQITVKNRIKQLEILTGEHKAYDASFIWNHI